jgi:hypothetical protein
VELITIPEANSCAETQEVPSFNGTQELQYCFLKETPLIALLSHTNKVHTIQILIFIVVNFILAFSTNKLHTFLFFPICAICTAHLALLGFIIPPTFGAEQKTRCSLLRSFLHPHVTLFFLSKYSLQHCFKHS